MYWPTMVVSSSTSTHVPCPVMVVKLIVKIV
jgi:hypothetical protein